MRPLRYKHMPIDGCKTHSSQNNAYHIINIKNSMVSSTVLFLIFIAINLQLSSCKKLIEIDSPINEVVGREMYATDNTAASVLTGIYAKMGNSGIFMGISSISLKTGLSADELVSITEPSDILSVLYTNSLTNQSGLFWTELYEYIFRINAAIAGIEASPGVTEPVKAQLLGEARFLRAFMYFYLINLYGDVPLLTSPDIKINSTTARIGKSAVYDQIVKDLIDAQSSLIDQYVGPDAFTTFNERTRPNKATATALLSRVYLFMGKFGESEAEATKIIGNSTYILEPLANVFLKTSKEAIWQLEPVQELYNTFDAVTFVLEAGPNNSPPAGPNGSDRPVYLSDHIVDAFEPNDQRKVNWLGSVFVNGSTYPYAKKYKSWIISQPKSEYLIVFRLAEQYLIRAEARAQQGKLVGSGSATEDLNVIRNRAELSEATASSKEDMLDAILHERQIELFTEWGHRWLDLKRSGKINQVMADAAPTKGGTWAPYKALYPIPILDIQRNPSLRGHQNPGYQEQ